MATIYGNKGEWSEIYVLFKLLGDGVVYAGDGNMEKIPDLYYPVLNIIRNEGSRYEYKPQTEESQVIVEENGVVILKIPVSRFVEAGACLLEIIRNANSRSFSVESIESFMNEIKCHRLKAGSGDKTDIRIVIHDLRTGMQPQLGFSIKSCLGCSSTLLNASRATNIVYRIDGAVLTDDEINAINSVYRTAERLKALTDRGYRLSYIDFESSVFKNNLLLMDGSLPGVLAVCLHRFYTGAGRTVCEIVEGIAAEDPMAFGKNEAELFYRYKMKTLLTNVALGMMPGRRWNGRYDANGGYLVVRKDGEVVCYHFYNRNDIEDYLYLNTRFESPSRTRHGYGMLYRAGDGSVYIKLNLQIRFM